MSAISGIFSATIIQRNPQDTSERSYPHRRPMSRPRRRLPELNPAVRKVGDARQLGDPLGDLACAQPSDPLDAELLDVERGERGPVRPRAAQQLALDPATGMRPEVTD